MNLRVTARRRTEGRRKEICVLAYFQEMFSYPFMVRAALVGVSVSVSAGLLGVSLVLKRYAMIGQGLSQVAFASLAIALCLHMSPMLIAMPVTVVAAYFILLVKEKDGAQADARLAMISTAALSLGVLFISISTGINTDVCNYLFGSLLAADGAELLISLLLLVLLLLLYASLYSRILLLSADEEFAAAGKIPVWKTKAILALLSALVIVLGMRTLGTLLISALLVFPAMSALRLGRSFKSVLSLSALLSFLCFAAGLCLSYSRAVPTGASIALMNALCFALVFLGTEIPKYLRRRELG